MSAQHILKDYIDGRRKPVQGPFTYVEALGLVAVNEQLLDALKDLVAIPFGSGTTQLLTKIKAHHNAHAAIKLAAGSVADVIDPPGLVRGISNEYAIHLTAAKHIDKA